MSDDVIQRLFDKIEVVALEVAALKARMDEQYKMLTLVVIVVGAVSAAGWLILGHH